MSHGLKNQVPPVKAMTTSYNVSVNVPMVTKCIKCAEAWHNRKAECTCDKYTDTGLRVWVVEIWYLSSKVWLRGEVLQASCHVGVASGLVDGSNQAVREEGAHTLGVAQAVHVDQLLRCAREGQASHICWEVVDVGVWHSNGAGVSVQKPLVIRLQ